MRADALSSIFGCCDDNTDLDVVVVVAHEDVDGEKTEDENLDCTEQFS